jgi:O-antigen ligase
MLTAPASVDPADARASDSSKLSDLPSPDAWTRHRLVLRMFILALVLAPALFGASDLAIAAFWCAWLAAAVLIAPLAGLSRMTAWWLAGTALIVLAYLFILHEQLAVRPFLAPIHPIWMQASEALGIPLQGSAATVRTQALYSIAPPMAALLAFMLGLICCDSAQHRRSVVVALRYSVVAYAVFGIVSTGIEPSLILWRERLGYVGAVTGPFINANTAADYFAAGALAWLVVVIQRSGAFSRSDIDGHGIRRAVWQLDTLDLPALAALIGCTAALLLTRSRVGVGLGCLALLGTFLALDHRPGRIWRRLLVPGITLLILLQMMGAALFARLDLLGFSGGGRIDTYRATLQMIGDNPWFGVGIGAFGAAFPAYRTSGNIWGVWDTAHSTPLELAAEAGLPLAGLVILAWCVLIVALTRRFISSPESIAKVALPVVIVGTLHSLVDFSLQTAGYAIPVLALAGAALRAEPAPKAASSHL